MPDSYPTRLRQRARTARQPATVAWHDGVPVANTPGVLVAPDEVDALADALEAADELSQAIPPSSIERPCPICRAFSNHMGDCALAAMRVHLVKLAALDRRAGREP